MNLNKVISLVFILIAISINNTFFAEEIEKPIDKVKYDISIEQNNCEVFILFNIQIVENWHINAANLPVESFSIPTQINLDSSKNFIVYDSMYEPDFEHIYDSIAKEDLYLHDGNITIKKKIEIISPKAFEINGEFVFQTCDDTHCLPIYSEGFNLKVNGCSKEEIKGNDINSNEEESESNFLIYIFIGITGLLAFLGINYLRKKK
jgi:thiol:disulfide interchange protein DsbD